MDNLPWLDQRPRLAHTFMVGGLVMLYALSILATAIALLVVDFLLPGLVISGFPTAILAGIVIGIVNAVIRPVLFILSLPVTILTLGLFALVVNGFSLWLAAAITPGFSVHGFWAFILGPILLSMVSTTLNRFLVGQIRPSQPNS